MSKIAVNTPCPCGSGSKYKKCCQRLHYGQAPANALDLMKSRYSAYAAGESRYIMATTHPMCPSYDPDPVRWLASLTAFMDNTAFQRLTILEFIDGATHASVTFHATLRQGGVDASFTEKSEFVCENGRWLYRSGKRI